MEKFSWQHLFFLSLITNSLLRIPLTLFSLFEYISTISSLLMLICAYYMSLVAENRLFSLVLTEILWTLPPEWHHPQLLGLLLIYLQDWVIHSTNLIPVIHMIQGILYSISEPRWPRTFQSASSELIMNWLSTIIVIDSILLVVPRTTNVISLYKTNNQFITLCDVLSPIVIWALPASILLSYSLWLLLLDVFHLSYIHLSFHSSWKLYSNCLPK